MMLVIRLGRLVILRVRFLNVGVSVRVRCVTLISLWLWFDFLYGRARGDWPIRVVSWL